LIADWVDDMKFLLKTPQRFKWTLSLYPPLWGTGIWVTHVSKDFREVVVTMASRFYNRNAFGAHFGGSLAAMTDPFPTLMLMRVLGSDYQIIDSETRIRFLEQAQGKVTARFVIDENALAVIRAATAGGDKHFAEFQVDITNEAGKTVTQVEKRIYVRLRRELRPPSSPSA
jgi:acyl-coenzyme A thioesterase PaaI-like protein